MKNRKLEITLFVIAILFTLISLLIHIGQGFSKAEMFNFSCSIILIMLWMYSLIKRKPKE